MESVYTSVPPLLTRIAWVICKKAFEKCHTNVKHYQQNTLHTVAAFKGNSPELNMSK